MRDQDPPSRPCENNVGFSGIRVAVMQVMMMMKVVTKTTKAAPMTSKTAKTVKAGPMIVMPLRIPRGGIRKRL